MTIHAIVHKVDGGEYWAEVPSIPGCSTRAETLAELCENLREAIAECLSVPVELRDLQTNEQVVELVL